MNPATNAAIVARLRSSRFNTPNELAAAIAAAIDGVAKNQTSKRGLHANNIVDYTGGTKLSVNDQSASRQSISTQPPQTMKLKKHGAISTRQQSRVDILTRVVPAMVTAVDGTGPEATITVTLVGDVPALSVDALTGQNIPADPLASLAGDAEDISGTSYTLSMSGLPFAGEGADEEGPKVPEVGQTIMITLLDQTQKRTIWTNRYGVNTPTVTSYPMNENNTAAALINGTCCKEPDSGGGGGS